MSEENVATEEKKELSPEIADIVEKIKRQRAQSSAERRGGGRGEVGVSTRIGLPPALLLALGGALRRRAHPAAVTIAGTGFAGATEVTFGGAAATGVTVVSPTAIVATTPPIRACDQASLPTGMTR